MNNQKKIGIFGVGASGMIGSRIEELLKDKYNFLNLSLESGINITDPATLTGIRDDKEHEIVLHLAAKADVDGCEKDKPLGVNGAAYKINVAGTQHIITACRKNNKKLIYISTDFVFSGNDTPEGGYTEKDTPHPINWYAETKYRGENVVAKSGLQFVIARPGFPYGKEFTLKKDFVHIILSKLKNNEKLKGITDQIITPTFIDDIASAIDKLIETEATGIYHVVGSTSLSSYDAAQMIAEKFGCDKSLIEKTTRGELYKDRAPRPFNLSLRNDKIQELGVKMLSFEEGLKKID